MEGSSCLIPKTGKMYEYIGSPHYLITNGILGKGHLKYIYFKTVNHTF